MSLGSGIPDPAAPAAIDTSSIWGQLPAIDEGQEFLHREIKRAAAQNLVSPFFFGARQNTAQHGQVSVEASSRVLLHLS